MCGFSGFIGLIDNPEQKLLKSLELLNHRGPDMSGHLFIKEKNMGFAHNRLSIIDTSKNAIQPFMDNNKNILVYNGELYNSDYIKKKLNSAYQINWKSSSDTEILFFSLVKFGVNKTLDMIEGMFAFAFFSSKNQSLYLARDIAGEKPLYYSNINNTLTFSSETKPLLMLSNKEKIIPKMIENHINANFNIFNKTIYNNINALRPGSFLEYNLSNKTLNLKKYWSYEKKFLEINNNTSFKNNSNNFENILNQAVHSQLVSDVPIGTFMSGGLDSTLISLIATKYNKNLDIYSLGYEDKNYDESSKAEKIAKYLGQRFKKIILKPDQLPSLFDSFIKKLDLPHTDQSDICLYYLCNEAAKTSKVILTGDGGDELFAGYNRHIWIKKVLNMKYLTRKFLYFSISPISIKIINILNNLMLDNHRLLDFESKIYKLKKILPYKDINKIYYSLLSDQKIHEFDLDFNNQLSNLRNILKYDFELYLPNNVLYKSDACSMYNSLELRSPYLSKNVIEYSLSLNEKEMLYKSTGKLVLRKILNKYLPSELIYSKKSGFSIPLAEWLSCELKEWASEIYFNPIINDIFSINIDLKKIWQDFIDNPKDNFQKVWNIIVINAWLKENTI